MRIKKLIVRKTKPSEEIIRDISFNAKGLSLIVDSTPEDMGKLLPPNKVNNQR